MDSTVSRALVVQTLTALHVPTPAPFSQMDGKSHFQLVAPLNNCNGKCESSDMDYQDRSFASMTFESKGVNQIEWKKQSGQTFFTFSPRDSQYTNLINYCRDLSFGFLDKVTDCSLLGEQGVVPYNFVDPERTSMVFSWTLTIDENGHSLVSEKGELLYSRTDGGKLLCGKSSMTVDVTFYASKTVSIDEFERGTCAPTPAAINDTVSGFTQTTVCDPNIKSSSQDLRLGCVHTSEGTRGGCRSPMKKPR